MDRPARRYNSSCFSSVSCCMMGNEWESGWFTDDVTLLCDSSRRPPQQSLSERPTDRRCPVAVLQHRGRPGPAGSPETPLWRPGRQRRHVSSLFNLTVFVIPAGWDKNQTAPFEFDCFFSHSPLHLAIIHQQTGVIPQLIHTLLSSQQLNILNTANHLQQVDQTTSNRTTTLKTTTDENS